MTIEGKGRERSRTKRVRPKKPYPDFPLFPHLTGRWAKKIRGRFAFFGPWEDPSGALARYLAQRDDLYAGRAAGPTASSIAFRGSSPMRGGGGLSVRDLANHFMTAKQRRLESGDMGKRSFADYHAACRLLVDGFGRNGIVQHLSAADFGVFRASLAKTRGPVALGNQINRVRSVFKYAYDAGLIEHPVRFGPEFVRPAMRMVRMAKRERGPRLFEQAEIAALLEGASPTLRAMVLLGINCGLGNTDIAELPISGLDLKRGTLDFPRPKTGIARRAALWPETVAAVRNYRRLRKEPADSADDNILFITKYRQRWVRVKDPGARSKGATKAVISDGVGLQFGKLLRATKTHKPGRSFYSLRHTFRTVADEVGDRRAVDLVMGHEPGGDIATHYIERIADDRLAKVSEHVRGWLFGSPGNSTALPGT